MAWTFIRGTGKDADKNRFLDEPGYKMVWERKTLPGPGAMNYAYESLALPPQSPISGAVAQRMQLRPTAQQVYKYQDGIMIGVPMVAGQVIMQPLYDPAVGYTGGRSEQTSILTALNIPVHTPAPVATNDPFPTKL